MTAEIEGIQPPPPCNRYPTCEGFIDDPTFPYPGDCTWPSCSEGEEPSDAGD